MDWSEIQQSIAEALGKNVELGRSQSIGGGSINSALHLSASVEGEQQSFFIKCNQPSRLAMFEAEEAGLKELESAEAIRVPHAICSGMSEANSYLVLEYLPLSASKGSSVKALAEQLVKLHQHTAKQFGWSRENTIGSTPQLNQWTDDWIEFLREQRFGYQLQLADRNGASHALQKKGQQLLDNLQQYFNGYEPVPSLLHGDLWSGNYGFDEQGAPVIFDPAVYYGDREADMAMTELFGGFPREFYSHYNALWPLDQGYKTRKTLYNLYHILNHFNIFGGGYGMQAESMLNQLVG